MRQTTTIIILAVMTSIMSTAPADTITLKNGVSMNGKVIKQTDTAYTIQTGPRTITISADEVAGVVKNAETGGFDIEKAIQKAEANDREITVQTGLDRKQRTTIQEQLALMLSANESDRMAAVNKLVAMGGEANVFGYLANWLPSLLPRFIPGVLKAMAEMDWEKANPIVREHCANPDGAARAAALILLGEHGDDDAMRLCASGLLDHAPEVQLASARALGEIGSKDATPALLAAFRQQNANLKALCGAALERIWADSDSPKAVAPIEDWETFWENKRGQTPGALDVASLAPLVPEGTVFQDE